MHAANCSSDEHNLAGTRLLEVSARTGSLQILHVSHVPHFESGPWA